MAAGDHDAHWFFLRGVRAVLHNERLRVCVPGTGGDIHPQSTCDASCSDSRNLLSTSDLARATLEWTARSCPTDTTPSVSKRVVLQQRSGDRLARHEGVGAAFLDGNVPTLVAAAQ